MANNAQLVEPKSLTKCGLWSFHKVNLVVWATQHCLLEHLDVDEVEALSKEALVQEILGAILRAEVSEEYRAAATDQVARPVADLI